MGPSSASDHGGRGDLDGGGGALGTIYRGSSSGGGALGPNIKAAAARIANVGTTQAAAMACSQANAASGPAPRAHGTAAPI
jgi:hypothetical protein